jgi:hypothetical protein
VIAAVTGFAPNPVTSSLPWHRDASAHVSGPAGRPGTTAVLMLAAMPYNKEG